MNIILFSENMSSKIEELIELDDETEVRHFDLSELDNYKQYNPSLIIFDCNIEKVREFCAIRKLECCALVVANKIPQNLIVRALSYDYILSPVDIIELNVRIKALLKTYEVKKNLIKTAICDELTGLYNRKYLHHRLEAEISRSKRYNTPVSCLMFDIDYFKIFNDMYETTEQQAVIFAERFRNDVEKMEFIPANEDERHPITISGGVACYPCMEDVEEDANTLIRYAEHALYNAKQNGKNKIVQFSKINLGN